MHFWNAKQSYIHMEWVIQSSVTFSVLWISRRNNKDHTNVVDRFNSIYILKFKWKAHISNTNQHKILLITICIRVCAVCERSSGKNHYESLRFCSFHFIGFVLAKLHFIMRDMYIFVMSNDWAQVAVRTKALEILCLQFL